MNSKSTCAIEIQFNFIFLSVYALTCSKLFFHALASSRDYFHRVGRPEKITQSAAMAANLAERATDPHSICTLFFVANYYKKEVFYY